MPQFDFFSFFVQTFWIFFFASAFYLLYLKLPLINFSQIIKMREKLNIFASSSELKLTKSYVSDNYKSSGVLTENS